MEPSIGGVGSPQLTGGRKQIEEDMISYTGWIIYDMTSKLISKKKVKSFLKGEIAI